MKSRAGAMIPPVLVNLETVEARDARKSFIPPVLVDLETAEARDARQLRFPRSTATSTTYIFRYLLNMLMFA